MPTPSLMWFGLGPAILFLALLTFLLIWYRNKGKSSDKKKKSSSKYYRYR